ncbi:MAG: hypothetical protein AMXMBFR57_38480 [Acidimicrobiia bacterium]|jgi:hypothetical protein
MKRLVAAVLLVLAASPLTAPFSVDVPMDLFGDGGLHVQAKKPVEDPLATVPAPVVATIAVVLDDTSPSGHSGGWSVPNTSSHTTPLRL